MTDMDRIIYTLGKIEVHGIDNMKMLLGCIQELQKINEASEKEA